MANSEIRLITIEEPACWDNALARCGRFDCYHLAGYHALAKARNEGDPQLLFFEHGGHCAALPLLVRPVVTVEGLERCELADATSVYGYPGLITTIQQSDAASEPFCKAFHDALGRTLDRLGIVSLFIRHNPLIDTAWLLAPLADAPVLGPTVAVGVSMKAAGQSPPSISSSHRPTRRPRRSSGRPSRLAAASATGFPAPTSSRNSFRPGTSPSTRYAANA